MVNTSCDDFSQLSWHVDDTLQTANGVRRHNRKYVCICKQVKKYCDDD